MEQPAWYKMDPALWISPGYTICPVLVENFFQIDGDIKGRVHDKEDNWQGQYSYWKEKKKLVVNFSGEQCSHTFTKLGRHVYRDEKRRQMLIPGDSTHAENVQGPDVPPTKVPENFRCNKTFIYYHPGKTAETLRLGRDKENNPKVSWQGGDPTGHWSEHMVEHGELPAGTDATKPVICITFHHKGNETLATTTIYGAVTGTTNVYRAIGTKLDNDKHRVYYNEEMRWLKGWHIVLIQVDA